MYPKMLLRKARLQKRLCYWEEAIKVGDTHAYARKRRRDCGNGWLMIILAWKSRACLTAALE